MLSTLRRPAAAAAAADAAAAAPPGLSRNLGPSSLYSSLLPPLLFASFSDSLEQTAEMKCVAVARVSSSEFVRWLGAPNC